MRVHVVVPAGFDDPGRPSGGNRYDQRICAGLAECGWDVRIGTVDARWSISEPVPRTRLAEVMHAIPDGETVLVDGLIASPAAAVLLPHVSRLRLTVLLHMLATDEGEGDPSLGRSERAVLESAAAVVVTSEWARRQVLQRFEIAADGVTVALPGVDHVNALPDGSASSGRLLCVGTLCHHKGQDVLIEALAELADLPWVCRLVGPTDRDPDFIRRLRLDIARHGLDSRVQLAGVLHGTALREAYADAELFIAPSRQESYGMAVTEALAHGLPVIATSVGGLPEALGSTSTGIPPGALVAPDRPRELAAAIHGWLDDPTYRRTQRAAVADRRRTLPTWDETTRAVAAALTAAERRHSSAHREDLSTSGRANRADHP